MKSDSCQRCLEHQVFPIWRPSLRPFSGIPITSRRLATLQSFRAPGRASGLVAIDLNAALAPRS